MSSTNDEGKEDGDLIKKEAKLTITKRPIFDFYQIWIVTEIDL